MKEIKQEDIYFVLDEDIPRKLPGAPEVGPIGDPQFVQILPNDGQVRAKRFVARSLREALGKVKGDCLIGIPVGRNGNLGIVFRVARVRDT